MLDIAKKVVWAALFSLGIVICVFFLFHDFIRERQFDFGLIDKAGIISGIILAIIGLILLLFEKYGLYEKNFFSTRLYFYEAILLNILVISIFLVGAISWTEYKKSSIYEQWAIGIYICHSDVPFKFSGNNIKNPVLTAQDVYDIKANFVSDPFLINEEGVYYMFFEVYNSKTRQGDIGLATSYDGANWHYKQIILDERFHLSYPCVFKWNNEYYMIPETSQVKSIRLYKSNNFPFNWVFIKTLLQGKRFVDNTVFNYDNCWWLFTETGENNTLRLYYSETPLGPWSEHPKSPIVNGDANTARMAGPVVVLGNRNVRYTQDDEPYYGNQVWAFEITALTKEDYVEKRVGEMPILKGYENWNTKGMHHISPLQVGIKKWIATVDGY